VWAHQVGGPRTAAKGLDDLLLLGRHLFTLPQLCSISTRCAGWPSTISPDHVGRHAARHVRGEESSAFSPDPRPPAPELRGLLDRVRLERVGTHRDPRHPGRAMSALRPGAWAPHPHVRSPSHTAVRGHSMAERCASRAKASAAEARTAPGRMAPGRCRLGAGRSGSW
jgi:hypothetical protein